ncbi:pilin, partial [Patescibacteria group bacterium]|nr:pilin [Patescibacteria group bacterium]
MAILCLIFIAGSFLIVPEFAFAQSDAAAEVASAAGLSSTSLTVIIGRIIGVFLSMLGVIFLIIVIYAGFVWMTSGGEAAKVEKAKKLLINATIGIIITLFSFAIVNFVFKALTGSGLFGGSTYSEYDGDIPIEPFSGSLGSGAIRDHYPARGATDVARNVKIFVTFKDQMDIESFIDGYDNGGTPLDVSDDVLATALRDKNILIYPTAGGEKEAFDSSQVNVGFTENLKTFVFTPPILGSASEDVRYSVRLEDSIKNADGEKVLDSGGYEWFFT